MALRFAKKGGSVGMNFEEMIKSLQREYLSGLPEKIALIENLISRQENAAIRDSFHKLKGTGRTYGLPEVSTLGELVEEVCIRRPVNTVNAANLGVAILREIHASRGRQVAFDLQHDPRLQSLQKLLQN
jgi:HPt (histidine-containing phosphotransfer) domain-containing protein